MAKEKSKAKAKPEPVAYRITAREPYGNRPVLRFALPKDRAFIVNSLLQDGHTDIEWFPLDTMPKELEVYTQD